MAAHPIILIMYGSPVDTILNYGVSVGTNFFPIFRWFKFTFKPPYTIAHCNLLSAIWDTSHWTSFLKFGLKTA